MSASIKEDLVQAVYETKKAFCRRGFTPPPCIALALFPDQLEKLKASLTKEDYSLGVPVPANDFTLERVLVAGVIVELVTHEEIKQ